MVLFRLMPGGILVTLCRDDLTSSSILFFHLAARFPLASISVG
jgi:hypothetical protein